MDLKSNCAPGLDEINSFLVQGSAEYIVIPLTYLVNMAFTQGKFPDILKMSKIIPLHKGGCKETITNYRPIALLSVFSKIIEKLLSKRIIDYLNQHHIFSNEQHGFRQGLTTTTAILNFIITLYEHLDNNDHVLGVFLDISKAFDCIDQYLLLEKLEKYGIRGNCLQLLKSYLTNRKQIVSVDKKISHEAKVCIGVPQGSILGPLLFGLYVNDLPNAVVHGNITMFADDTTLLHYNSCKVPLVYETNENLLKVEEWFSANKLLLNTSKSVCVKFSLSRAEATESMYVKCKERSLMQVDNTKFLGIYIDNKLNWNCHICYLCNQLASVCFSIRKLKDSVSTSVILIYYYSHFYSRLKYGILFWGNSTNTCRIFRMQKRVVRIIAGVNRNHSCRLLFKKFNILPLACVYIYEILLYVRNNLDKFLQVSCYHNYKTRNDNMLLIPNHKTAKYEKSPYYTGIILYNKLAETIKNAKSCSIYKKLLKDFLQDKVFYTIDEYLSDM